MADGFIRFANALLQRVFEVLSYPLNAETRIYWLYLLSSLLLALWVYVRSGPGRASPSIAGFGRFLFPREIWRTESAWLDVRYFFFHQIVRLSIYGGFITILSNLTYRSCIALGANILPAPPFADTGNLFLATAIYAVLFSLLADFAAYWMHYLQHRLPLLWEFHKVHHSATVLHPLTNYREHPVDNLLYAVAGGTVLGIFVALAVLLLGHKPITPTVLGLSLFVFLYNFSGYNLRHSHIWLKWPGIFSKLLGSPAHHQVHHSCRPQHVDKNFAFMFPIWDVLFGTFCLPDTNRDLKFGLNGDPQESYNRCWQLYFLPFRNLFSADARHRNATGQS